jgi:hypothetical protein
VVVAGDDAAAREDGLGKGRASLLLARQASAQGQAQQGRQDGQKGSHGRSLGYFSYCVLVTDY